MPIGVRNYPDRGSNADVRGRHINSLTSATDFGRAAWGSPPSYDSNAQRKELYGNTMVTQNAPAIGDMWEKTNVSCRARHFCARCSRWVRFSSVFYAELVCPSATTRMRFCTGWTATPPSSSPASPMPIRSRCYTSFHLTVNVLSRSSYQHVCSFQMPINELLPIKMHTGVGIQVNWNEVGS